MKNIALIPARTGSTRLKLKALCEINGESLLGIALKKAKLSNIFDEVVCLGDSYDFKKIALKCGAHYISRDIKNSSNTSKSDEVIFEAINRTNPDYIFWLNLTHPFTKISTIKKSVNLFQESKKNIDSIFTTHSWLSHASFSENLNEPINYNLNDSFAQTQSMKKITCITYGIMAWNSNEFIKRYLSKGAAMVNGKIGTIEVSRIESIGIKYQADLELILSIVNKKNIWDFVL